MRRQHKCMKNGFPASATKPWKYQEQMSFLQPYMASRKHDANLNDQSDEELTMQEELLKVEIVECNGVLDVSDMAAKIACMGEDESVGVTDSSSTISPNKAKNDVPSQCKQSLTKRKNWSAERAKKRRKILEDRKTSSDPLFYFFMSMYETTRNMPPSSQYIVRNNIFKAVAEMEATLLDIPQSS